MRLTRRDAMVALGAMGGAVLVGSSRRNRTTAFEDDDTVRLLHAAAEAIYPSDVEIDRAFIDTFVRGRLATRQGAQQAQTEALADLDRRSRHVTGRSFPNLSIDDRRQVLRTIGVHRAPPVPDGTEEERIRFHVVNDLLYVFFSTPPGASLVGLHNPPGYPGGRQAYQRTPLQ